MRYFELERAHIDYIEESTNINTRTYRIKDPKFKEYAIQAMFVKRSWEAFKDGYDGEILVDIDNNVLIGTVFVGDKKDKGFINSLWVKPKYRRQGFATLLMNDAITKMKGIDLTVSRSNKSAINLYKKLGFVIIGDGNSKSEYWMKLRSKLTKDDKVINESYDDIMTESYIINEKDIYYNKDKFDSGEINLCFITGHSGSGKSTMGRNLQDDIIEHYELDDLQCVKDHFSMDELKKYGDLIYSFFNGAGKKFYKSLKELKEEKIPSSEYEDKMFVEFVKYAMKYAKSHKDKKYVLEGVWLFCTGENGKPWFEPSEFKDYAFYIKGTSMIISKHRAALRDSKDAKTKIKEKISYLNNFLRKNWKWYFIDENRVNRFRKYFLGITENNINESVNLFSENVISPKKLYHGSYQLFKSLRATGIDFGNSFQKPGWSLFCWMNEDDAIGWSIFCVLRNIQKKIPELSGLVLGCKESRIPILDEDKYYHLEKIFHSLPKDLCKFYIYEVTPKKDHEIGFGHSSNTLKCITIRTDKNIKYDLVKHKVLTLNMISKYCIITDSYKDITANDTGKNKRFLSFFMKYDYMYNHKVRKILKRAVQNGELEIGDDILAYLKKVGVELHEVGIMERISDIVKKESVNDWSYIMETEEPIEINELETFLESTGSYILRDSIYPYIETTFKSNPANVRKFNSLVAQFIDRNIDKLTTSGPVYLIPFTDKDKSNYYELFNIEESFIKKTMKEHIKSLNSSSQFLLLSQNPIFSLFYFVIRYFTLNPDNKSLNSALSIYALSAYPSIYTKYFPYGVIEPVMRYTIDNLTDKFLIKKSKHIFGVLVESAQRSYKFLKPFMKDGSDKEVIRFIQRIRNDHNSLFKKIANMYNINHKNGNAISTSNTVYDDDTPIVDEINNATTEVQNAVLKVSMPIISNGVDIIRAEASAKMSGIGVSDCRFFLTNIMIDKNIDQLQRMIESILFLYLYEDKKTIRDIRSQYFLAWAASLFKKTNSKNDNINRINQILNHWAEESGIYAKFRREASRINYKKALFFYVILSIQKYI